MKHETPNASSQPSEPSDSEIAHSVRLLAARARMPTADWLRMAEAGQPVAPPRGRLPVAPGEVLLFEVWDDTGTQEDELIAEGSLSPHSLSPEAGDVIVHGGVEYFVEHRRFELGKPVTCILRRCEPEGS